MGKREQDMASIMGAQQGDNSLRAQAQVGALSDADQVRHMINKLDEVETAKAAVEAQLAEAKQTIAALTMTIRVQAKVLVP